MERGTRPVEHHLDCGSVTLNYAEVLGDGPTVLLLHGLGARWQVFGPLLVGLRGQGHLYALDFRGHGASGRTPGHYRLEDYAADALALLRRVPTPVIIYGHSLGGWVALSLAASCPAEVSGIIVADSAVFPEHISPDLAVSYLADLPMALRSLAKSLNQLDPEVMEHFRDGRLTAHYDPESLLPRVGCPTLLLQGDAERDALMTDEDVRRALELLPDGAHRRFPGAGHGLHVENAGQVLDTVLPFLKAHGEPH
jgi:pimeloyl-ACP methyl ester carboxylesterase